MREKKKKKEEGKGNKSFINLLDKITGNNFVLN